MVAPTQADAGQSTRSLLGCVPPVLAARAGASSMLASSQRRLPPHAPEEGAHLLEAKPSILRDGLLSHLLPEHGARVGGVGGPWRVGGRGRGRGVQARASHLPGAGTVCEGGPQATAAQGHAKSTAAAEELTVRGEDLAHDQHVGGAADGVAQDAHGPGKEARVWERGG